MKALYVAPLIATLLAACGAAPKSFDLVNPTGSALTVSIDGQSHQVPAGGSLPLQLASGAHTLQTAAHDTINFMVLADDRGGLINPTHSAYVIARSVKPQQHTALHRFDDGARGASVDGTLYPGPYRLSTAVVIPRSWRAGLAEVADTGVSESGFDDAKVFAAHDFVAYYREVIEGPDTFAYVVNPGMPAPTYQNALAHGGVARLMPVFGSHVDDLRHVYTAYVGRLTPAARERDLHLVYQPVAKSDDRL